MHNKKGKTNYLLYKIDFEKAYDWVNWEFLKLTLTEFGFPSKIIGLITSCTTTSSLSLKWNNEILERFSPTRSLQTRRSYVSLSFCSLHGKASVVYSRQSSI